MDWQPGSRKEPHQIEFEHTARDETKGIRKLAGKPGSVLRRNEAAVISLAARLPERSSSLPGSRGGPDRSCSHIWPCSRRGLPSQPVTRLLVGSYIKGLASPHRFTLTLVSGEW